MKTAVGLLLCFGLTWLFACRTEAPLSPAENLDSLECDQSWKQFKLAKDSVVVVRYNQETKILSGKDTLKLSLKELSDECSEESARVTFGCKATVTLSLQLNSECIFITKYPLEIPRYSRGESPIYVPINEIDCKVRSTNFIDEGPSRNLLAHYNQLYYFRQILPFAKTDNELIEYSKNKSIYFVTLNLKVRCF